MSTAPTRRDPQDLDADLPRIWIQPHYASFNGLRGVAVFLVFLVHYGMYILPAQFFAYMWVGVDLFFVLSGFLITGILYDSLHDPRYFRNFYVRRALRIFPIFYGFFLLVFLLMPFLRVSFAPALLFYVVYLGNLVLPFTNLITHNPTAINLSFHGHFFNINIGHLWSLCVEEQFYMLWPAMVWMIRSRIRLMHVCTWISLAVLFERIYLQTHAPKAELAGGLVLWSPFTRIDTLLVGAFLALWLREAALSRKQLRRISAVLLLLPVSALVLVRLRVDFAAYNDFIMTSGLTLIALASAGVLLRSLDSRSRFSQFLRIRSLSDLGAVSYGFYFIHHLYIYEFQALVGRRALVRHFEWIIPFVAFFLSLLLAKLSFRFLEAPFLKLKSKLAPQWVPDSVPSTGIPSEGGHLSVALHLSEPRP